MKIKKQIKYIFGTAVFLAIAAVLLTLTTYVMRPTDKDFFLNLTFCKGWKRNP